MVKLEEKFIVINRKHLKNIPAQDMELFSTGMNAIAQHLPKNKYWVCNQDEPYAHEVEKIILAGETLKEKGNCKCECHEGAEINHLSPCCDNGVSFVDYQKWYGKEAQNG